MRVLLLLLLVACARPAPVQPVPTCAGVGGMVHASSRCWRYDRRSGQLAPIATRAGSRQSLGCGDRLELGGLALRVDCDGSPHGTTTVLATITDGGTVHEHTLDRHTGFYDFINVWVEATPEHLDLTVDYAILD